MSERYIKVDDANGYVVAITIGQVPRTGVTFIEQTADNATVSVGWSYKDGAFTDTSAAYRSRRG